MELGSFIGSVVNGIPVLGHVKSVYHYACGDTEVGDSALEAASRTTAVVGGGLLGFVVGGPFGAVAGAVAGGATVDTTITVVDTGINGRVDGRLRTHGILEPFSDPTDTDLWINAGCTVVLDGFCGWGISTRAARIALARPLFAPLVPIRPSTTVLMMVRNECLYFMAENARGKTEVIVLQHLLTDVGPKTVEVFGQTISFLIRNGDVFYEDTSYQKHKLRENHVYNLDRFGFIMEILDYLTHFASDGRGGKKNRWIHFWNNPKRVAVLRAFLKLVAKS